MEHVEQLSIFTTLMPYVWITSILSLRTSNINLTFYYNLPLIPCIILRYPDVSERMYNSIKLHAASFRT